MRLSPPVRDDLESKNPKDLFHWPPVRVMETSMKKLHRIFRAKSAQILVGLTRKLSSKN